MVNFIGRIVDFRFLLFYKADKMGDFMHGFFSGSKNNPLRNRNFHGNSDAFFEMISRTKPILD